MCPHASEACDLARDMEILSEVLEAVRVYFAALDQADSARHLAPLAYSPLRTRVEHAEVTSRRVTEHLWRRAHGETA